MGVGYEKILLLLGEAPVLQLSEASYMNEMKFSYKYFSFSSAGKKSHVKGFFLNTGMGKILKNEENKSWDSQRTARLTIDKRMFLLKQHPEN